jgi:organic hydroperoxide reductase OsmC/OhrA
VKPEELMSDVANEFSISVDQISDFEFRVKFDRPQHPHLLMDEPPPLGNDSAPSAARVLAAAIGDCLSASLLFCSRRMGVKIENIHTEVKVQIVRNENRRLRVGKIDVMIDPGLDAAAMAQADKCLGAFEDFCTVTQSVRAGIPVNVTVKGTNPQ